MALPDWLNNYPDWLSRLAADPAAAELGLVWLSEAEGNERAQSIAETFEGEGSPLVPLPPQVLAAARKSLSGKVVIGLGPSVPMRVSEGVIESLLIIDQTRPDELLIALSRDYPPFLWIPAGTTVQSIQSALAGYFLKEAPPRARLHRIVRYFFGNERMLDTDIYGIENHYVASPFTAELSWGSACADDPWPSKIEGEVDTVNFMNNVREQSRQEEGGVYTTSFRLQHSRGILTLEDHEGLFVIEIRYLPSPHRDVVVGLNRRFDFIFPSDMPVDAVASLLALSLQTEATLKDTLSDHELAEDHDLVLNALAALKYGDLTVGNDLHPFLRPPTKANAKPGSLRAPTIPPPPSVRDAAISLTQELEMDFVLLKHAAAKSELEALGHLTRALDKGPIDAWEGAHGPDLLIASDAVARQSIDWIWGDQHWSMVQEIARGPKRFFQRRWQTRDGSAEITYVEDHRLGLRFFTVEGEGRDAVLTRVRSALALEDLEVAMTGAESTTEPGDRVGAILKIARLAPPLVDARWSAMLRTGLAHENIAVRAASVLAAAYIGWPELVPLLKRNATESMETHAEHAIEWIRHRQRHAAK